MKNGKGSIWHDAGSDRFDSSMKSPQKLGELGSTLHLSNTATSLRDETQLQVLQNRGNSLYEVYNEASKEAAKGGHEKNASDIDPTNVKPKKDTKGLVPGL